MHPEIQAAIIAEASKLIGLYLRTRPVNVSMDNPHVDPPPSVKFKLPEIFYDSEPKKTDKNKQKMLRLVESGVKTAVLEAPVSEEEEPVEELEFTETVKDGAATNIQTGCIPCAMGHFSTCTSLINEAVRFAHADGVASDEVIDRVGMCLQELNGMERVDLRPEMIVQLQGEERKLAQHVLNSSRGLRHQLESLKTVEALEEAAAKASENTKLVNRTYMRLNIPTEKVEEEASVEEENTVEYDRKSAVRAAFESLTPEQQKKVIEKLREKTEELEAFQEDEE